MRVLTFEEASNIIKMFEYLNSSDSKRCVLASDLIYKNNIENGFGECIIEIYSFSNHLFLRTISDGEDYLEPLLIQVEDDGTIIDFMLLDFVLRYRESHNLEDYFVLQSDYSYIMDRVRSFY